MPRKNHVSTLASLHTLESTNASLRDLCSSSATEMKQLKGTVQEIGSTARKADTRARLAEREVEFLPSLVKSYERDVGRIQEPGPPLSEYKYALDSITGLSSDRHRTRNLNSGV